eukprot:TRINITY_DN8829_c0_g1_i1.p1 TRINITY_DN8829_c0_g1~~TRINITY_DN8829_c0_g1_i1.p1  ORF type:complete len:802 (-),score=206.02 TRINITY_DN8829_c0_g1_i1:34-2142(-)
MSILVITSNYLDIRTWPFLDLRNMLQDERILKMAKKDDVDKIADLQNSHKEDTLFLQLSSQCLDLLKYAKRSVVFSLSFPIEDSSEKTSASSTDLQVSHISRNECNTGAVLPITPRSKTLQKSQNLSYEEVSNCTKQFSELLGVGGFGEVFKGYYHGVEVAVKRFKETNMKFEIESFVLLMVPHPNLLRALAICDELDHKCIIMEYKSGGSLESHLSSPEKMKELSEPLRIKIMKDITCGLYHLHSQNICHLDIKPGNILLDENMNAVLSDYNLSRIMENGNTFRTLSVSGTEFYIAPETQNSLISSKCDIYGLGIVFIQLLTRLTAKNVHINFSDNPDPIIDKMNKAIVEKIDDSIAWNMEVFQKCSNIAFRCIKHDRADRPTADDLRKEFEKIQELCPVHNASFFPSSGNFNKPQLDQITESWGENIGKNELGEMYHGTYLGCDVIVTIMNQFDQSFLQNLIRTMKFNTTNPNPRIIPLLGFLFDIKTASLYLVHQSIQGGNIEDSFANPRFLDRFDLKKRTQVALDVANGISCLHSNGFLHLGIRLDTIFLNNLGRAFVLQQCVPSLFDSKFSRYVNPMESGHSESFDVFSFGTLLKLLLQNRSESASSQKWSESAVQQLNEIATKCCSVYENKDRPYSFARISFELDTILKECFPTDICSLCKREAKLLRAFPCCHEVCEDCLGNSCPICLCKVLSKK